MKNKVIDNGKIVDAVNSIQASGLFYLKNLFDVISALEHHGEDCVRPSALASLGSYIADILIEYDYNKTMEDKNDTE